MDNLNIKDSVLLMNVSLYGAMVFTFLLLFILTIYFFWKADRKHTKHFFDLKSTIEKHKKDGGK
jgi:Gpi18-like mannosyltransferase